MAVKGPDAAAPAGSALSSGAVGQAFPNGKGLFVAMGINEECLIVSGPGADTPLHAEDMLLGAVNINLGPAPSIVAQIRAWLCTRGPYGP